MQLGRNVGRKQDGGTGLLGVPPLQLDHGTGVWLSWLRSVPSLLEMERCNHATLQLVRYNPRRGISGVNSACVPEAPSCLVKALLRELGFSNHLPFRVLCLVFRPSFLVRLPVLLPRPVFRPTFRVRLPAPASGLAALSCLPSCWLVSCIQRGPASFLVAGPPVVLRPLLSPWPRPRPPVPGGPPCRVHLSGGSVVPPVASRGASCALACVAAPATQFVLSN